VTSFDDDKQAVESLLTKAGRDADGSAISETE
jgi:hypothetical protein